MAARFQGFIMKGLPSGERPLQRKSHVCDHTCVLERNKNTLAKRSPGGPVVISERLYSDRLPGCARAVGGELATAPPTSQPLLGLSPGRPAASLLPSLCPDLWSPPAPLCAGFLPNPFCSSPFILATFLLPFRR